VDVDVADDGAKSARQVVAERRADVAAAAILVGALDVGDDEEVGGQHLPAADVGAALQLALRREAAFLLAHRQALVAVDHPKAAGPQSEHLQHRLRIAEPERTPPVAAIRLVDGGDADRPVAVRQVLPGRLMAGIAVHAVGLVRVGEGRGRHGSEAADGGDGKEGAHEIPPLRWENLSLAPSPP
jgi:hypothetical protein